MNQRIKKIRRVLDLTQQTFAERIGMKQNSIALIESGKRNISDQAILSICREFDVREEWLRTGKGEMFKPKPSDILDQLAYKYKLFNFDYVMIEKFLEMPTEIRRAIYEHYHDVDAALAEMDPYAPAYAGTIPPRPMDDVMNLQKALAEIPDTPEELERKYPPVESNKKLDIG